MSTKTVVECYNKQGILKLSPLVTRIVACNPGKFTLEGTNTYIIGKGKKRIILDTGEGILEYERILNEYLKSENAIISTIILTHWHHDHVKGVPFIYKKYGNFLLNEGLEFNIWKYPSALNDNKFDFLSKNQINIKSLYDGQCLGKEEGFKLYGFHTPGHTDDHFVFWLEEEKCLFSGDNILGKGSSVFENLSQYIKSLQRIYNLFNKNIKAIYPGHGAPILDNPSQKINDYISHRISRENQIISIMKSKLGIYLGTNSSSSEPFSEGVTPSSIVEIIYKDYPKSLWIPAEIGIILHLEKLKNDGKVYSINDEWWLTNDFINGKL